MKYKVGIYKRSFSNISVCGDGLENYELFFKKHEYVSCAVRVFGNYKKKYNNIYDIDYICFNEDDYRAYVVCEDEVLYELLEKINYELQDYCDVNGKSLVLEVARKLCRNYSLRDIVSWTFSINEVYEDNMYDWMF